MASRLPVLERDHVVLVGSKDRVVRLNHTLGSVLGEARRARNGRRQVSVTVLDSSNGENAAQNEANVQRWRRKGLRVHYYTKDTLAPVVDGVAQHVPSVRQAVDPEMGLGGFRNALCLLAARHGAKKKDLVTWLDDDTPLLKLGPRASVRDGKRVKRVAFRKLPTPYFVTLENVFRHKGAAFAYGSLHGSPDTPLYTRLEGALQEMDNALINLDYARGNGVAPRGHAGWKIVNRALDNLAVGRATHEYHARPSRADNPKRLKMEPGWVHAPNRTHTGDLLRFPYAAGRSEDFAWSNTVGRAISPKRVWRHGMSIVHYEGRPVSTYWNLPFDKAKAIRDKLEKFQARRDLPADTRERVEKARGFFTRWMTDHPGSQTETPYSARPLGQPAITPHEWKRALTHAAALKPAFNPTV